jgi:hypothetical protein
LRTEGRASEEEEMAVSGTRAQSSGKGQLRTEGRTSEEEVMEVSEGRAQS